MTRFCLLTMLLAAACFVLPLAAMRPGLAVPALSPAQARIAQPSKAKLDRAQAALNQATASQLCQRGVTAQLNKRPADAEDYYRRALGAADPNGLEAARIYKYRGILFHNQNRTGEAEHDFLSALTIEEKTPGADGDRADTLQLYSGVLRDTGRTDQARIQADLAADLRTKYFQDAIWGNHPSGEPAIRVGGSVLAPKRIDAQEPQYSDLARLAKFQGAVVLQVEIGTDGQAHNILVRKPLGLGLDEKAAEAVRTWRFEPATRDGQPVAVKATIEVNFRLL